MENRFDTFSKSLAESVSRRDTLRRLGAVFAGVVLSPLALGTARAGGPGCPPDLRWCGEYCADLYWDNANCGACGNVCPPQFACAWGTCEGYGY